MEANLIPSRREKKVKKSYGIQHLVMFYKTQYHTVRYVSFLALGPPFSTGKIPIRDATQLAHLSADSIPYHPGWGKCVIKYDNYQLILHNHKKIVVCKYNCIL